MLSTIVTFVVCGALGTLAVTTIARRIDRRFDELMALQRELGGARIKLLTIRIDAHQKEIRILRRYVERTVGILEAQAGLPPGGRRASFVCLSARRQAAVRRPVPRRKMLRATVSARDCRGARKPCLRRPDPLA